MPFNESAPIRKSNLSNEQKAEALESLYPKQEEVMSEKVVNNFIDLSKPVIVPYTHQEFPKMVYDVKASKPSRVVVKENLDGSISTIHVEPKVVSKRVNNEAELKAALAKGLSAKPPVMHPVLVEEKE